MPELPVKERLDSMVEVDLVISEKDARYESGRCLSCCRLCYNREDGLPEGAEPEAPAGDDCCTKTEKAGAR